MGSLYLARDPAIDRLVAIKLLRDDFDNQELRERFAREARAAGGLRHPNIVVIFDVGEHEGQPFIAMEYIPGQTLGAIIKGGQPLAFTRTLEIVENICAGLGYAHRAGIVHRDIKPANIMIDSGGVVKVLDFGIAHVAQSGMTKSGSVVGTLNYMSPEQVLGKPVDRRCDVFAVGAVLYELVARRQAFPGGLQEGILNRIVSEQPTPLTEIHPGVNPTLDRIVRKSLEKDPARRYQDLTQMQQELVELRKAAPETPRPEAEAVTMPLGASAQVEGPSGHRETDRELMVKRRASEIEEYLREADAAFESGEYQAAIVACERAAVLDPDRLHALDLLARARTAMQEGKILQLVGEARAQLHEGALTQAGDLLDQARAAGVRLKADPTKDSIESVASRSAGRWRVPGAIAAVAAAAALLAFLFLRSPASPPTQPEAVATAASAPAAGDAPPPEVSVATPAPARLPSTTSAVPTPAALTETPTAPPSTGQPAPSPTTPSAPTRPARASTSAPRPAPVNPRTFGTPSSTTADEAAIRRTLQRYQQALTSLDPAAVRAVYPSVNMQGLAAQLATYSSFRNEMQIGRIQIGPNGQTAMVTGLVLTAPVLKATGRETVQRRPTTIVLQKAGDSWFIQETRLAGRAGEAGARSGQTGGAQRRGRQ